MDFLGGALPNVMFIIGVLAIGLGLGIELKLVPLNKEIDKTGRIGAIVVGALLVAVSLYIYLNPGLSNRAATSTANAALVPAAATPVSAAQAPTAPAAAAPAAPEPSATPVPTSVPEPSATPVPTAVPPTEVPSVVVPNLHSLGEKEANEALKKAGLQARKVDKCTGEDQGEAKVKKNRIVCQSPAAEARVAVGSIVEFVLSK